MKTTEKIVKFKAFVRSVERSNVKFAKATQDERIVMVARDVLALLGLGRIEAEHSVYVDTYLAEYRPPKAEGCQVSDLLKDPQMPTCQVCAIGGAMIAATLRLNRVPFEPDPSGDLSGVFNVNSEAEPDTMAARASDVFPTELLRTMENAFEDGDFNYSAMHSSAGRLRAIYQNLIDNKGKRFTGYRRAEVAWPDPDETEFDRLQSMTAAAQEPMSGT